MKLRNKRGFTLVETVIAMGIIAILMTAFIGAFGPAVKGVQKSVSKRDINRLAATLEADFSYLKSGDEQTDYDTAFHKAYEWIEASGSDSLDDALLIYQYRGDPSSLRDDQTLSPQTDTSSQIPGEDYVLQSVIRRLGDSEVSEELQPGVVVGRVFYVKLTQLIFDETGLVLGTAGEIIDPTLDSSGAREDVSSYEDYPDASLAFEAEFYVLKSNIYSYVSNSFNLSDGNNDGHPDATGRSIFTTNMAIMR